jgi:hypothetical protein
LFVVIAFKVVSPAQNLFVSQSGQTDPVTEDARVFFPNPFNPVTGYLAQGPKIPAAGGVIGQKLDLGPAWQTLSPFFET